uniref:Small ribosomal subunit protein uS9c n=1 Tax=Pleurastrosarcina brevispinosa TaxID=163096 RepID=A0A097KN63_9CHLO|nr:ribosomal protein S9 [Chlorosarcina brevispinosa]
MSVGRRKAAVARVKIIPGTGKITINGQPGLLYLQNNRSSILSVQAPFNLLKLQENFDTIVNIQGGGLRGQAEAIKLGISRALCEIENSFEQVSIEGKTLNEKVEKSEISKKLKNQGYLTRDSRCKERRKYGLKKARKAPQFSKR